MLTNFRKKNIGNQKGFSIMELIVVLAIFSLGLLGIASLMLQTMQAEATNAGYLRASMLAQEGIEIVRGYRDDNWLDQTATAWDDDFGNDGSDETFIVDYSPSSIDYAPDLISEASTTLRKNLSGYYEHKNGVPTNFKRLITATACPVDDCYNIKSTVTWTASGKSHVYVAETVLYDWR